MTDRDGFASTGLVALFFRALTAARPELLPPGLKAPDPMKAATLAAADKREFLETIHAKAGAGPLLGIARHLDHASDMPTLQTVMRSPSAAVLAEKWMRLERYYHASNRTRITVTGNSLVAARHAESGQPVPSENALIAGLLTGLVTAAGAGDVMLEIDRVHVRAEALDMTARLAIDDGARFTISWQSWPGRAPAPPVEDASLPPLERLRLLLAADIGRGWRVGEAAPLLALSVRSLQRQLTDDGRSFSSVLRQTRISEAGTMLAESATPLAEIGYCCGYADQAHFQRDFRRALNLTPAEFRRIAHTE